MRPRTGPTGFAWIAVISFAFTAAALTPSGKDDCPKEGWRDFVDGQGSAFKSQGSCIAWVVSH